MHYKDKRWEAKRKKALRRDSYTCQECKRYGRRTTAEHVHHIVPLEWCIGTLLAFELRNLISLCKACHDSMHDRVNRELTEKGLNLLRRIFKQEADKWIKRREPPHV